MLVLLGGELYDMEFIGATYTDLGYSGRMDTFYNNEQFVDIRNKFIIQPDK